MGHTVHTIVVFLCLNFKSSSCMLISLMTTNGQESSRRHKIFRRLMPSHAPLGFFLRRRAGEIVLVNRKCKASGEIDTLHEQAVRACHTWSALQSEPTCQRPHPPAAGICFKYKSNGARQRKFRPELPSLHATIPVDSEMLVLEDLLEGLHITIRNLVLPHQIDEGNPHCNVCWFGSPLGCLKTYDEAWSQKTGVKGWPTCWT